MYLTNIWELTALTVCYLAQEVFLMAHTLTIVEPIWPMLQNVLKTLTLGWLSGSLYNQSKTASSFTPSPNAVWSKHLVEKRNLFYHYMYMWPNFQKGKLSWKIIWTNIYLQLLTILYKWMKFGIQEDLSFMFLRDQISCTTWLNDNKKCVYCIIYVVMEVASFRRTCPIN